MKYPSVLQHSEEDCGAACLATIAKYYGRNYTLNRMREVVGTGQLGTTLLGLRKGAEQLGFNAQAAKASQELLDRINEAPLPMIIHWKGYHWVVLYGKKRNKYILADPGLGVRRLKRQELLEGWSDGVMLLLELDSIKSLPESDKVSGFGRFLQRSLPYKKVITEVIFVNIAVGLLSLAIPFLIQILTDDVLVRQDTDLLTKVALAVIGINIFNSTFQLVQFNLIAHLVQRLELGLILDFARQILRLPLNYYESRRSGEVVSRLQDIQQINYLVTQLIANLPSQFFIALVSVTLMAFYSINLTFFALIIACLMTLSTFTFLPSLKKKTQTLMITEAENQGILVETFKGAITLKTTNSARQIWDEFQQRFGKLANLNFRRTQIGIVNNIFSQFVSALGTISLLWLGSKQVITQELTIGQLLAFNTMNGYLSNFIASAVGLVDEFTSVRVAVARINEIIDSTPEDSQDKSWAKFPENLDIICSDLNFSHPGRVNLLNDFSVTIPGGQITALIGESGCGKSTLTKLISGLYSLQSGNIRYGMFNQQDLSLECLREQVVLVSQEAHFWSRSILDNFRLGSPHITFEEIVRACQIACADGFISELPEKYYTILGEFGANLSGGQRQRLAIARGLVKDPPVLILDESTSGLDPVLEARVLANIMIHRRGKTTILISHRPRVILLSDRVILLDKGRLILEGDPEDLLEISGDHLDFLKP